MFVIKNTEINCYIRDIISWPIYSYHAELFNSETSSSRKDEIKKRIYCDGDKKMKCFQSRSNAQRFINKIKVNNNLIIVDLKEVL